MGKTWKLVRKYTIPEIARFFVLTNVFFFIYVGSGPVTRCALLCHRRLPFFLLIIIDSLRLSLLCFVDSNLAYQAWFIAVIACVASPWSPTLKIKNNVLSPFVSVYYWLKTSRRCAIQPNGSFLVGTNYLVKFYRKLMLRTKIVCLLKPIDLAIFLSWEAALHLS